MGAPSKTNSLLADKDGLGYIDGSARPANVADAAAVTAFSAPLPAQAVTVVSEAATDLDDVAAALETLRDEVAAQRLVINLALDTLETHGLMVPS